MWKEVIRKIKTLFFAMCDELFGSRPKCIYATRHCKTCIPIAKNQILKCYIGETVVLELNIEDKKYYFRECEVHTSFQKYIRNFTDLYFCVFCAESDYSEIDRAKVYKCLSNENTFRQFLRIGSGDLITSSASYRRFRWGTIDVDSFGIDTEEDECCIKRMSDFLRFARVKILAYYSHRFYFFKNKFQTANSCKELAYESMADLLGIRDYVAHAHYCFLKINEKYILFGTLMENADGFDASKLSQENRIEGTTPTFQKVLLNLSLLDYLCSMRDHTMYNFNVTTDSMGRFLGVKCFDNNEAGAFCSSEELFCEGAHGESSYIDEKGSINRPYIDFKMAQRILQLKKKDLYKALRAHLRIKLVLGTWRRVVALQNAISKEMHQSNKFALVDDDWNEDTIQEELSGKYGKTYLVAMTNKK